jgi:hypothetical protein
LTPTDNPDIASPVGQVIYGMGYVVYAHGDHVRGYWPGKEPKVVPLSAVLGEEPWRFMAHGGHLFAVHDEKVEIIDMGTWGKSGGFNGKYFRQLSTGTHWVGLSGDGGNVSVEFRGEAGQPAGENDKIKLKREDVSHVAALGNDVIVATPAGKAFRCGLKASTGLRDFAKDHGELLHLATVHGSIFTATLEKGRVHLRLLDPNGNPRHETTLEATSLPMPPVIMGDHAYVVGDERNAVHVVDLKTLLVEDKAVLQGLSEIRSMNGMYDEEQRVLLVVGVDSDETSGCAVVFEPNTGYLLRLCAVGAQSKVDFIPADGRLALATCTSYQNIVRVFDPFRSSGQSAKAA